MILSSIIFRYGLSSVVPKKMRDIYQPLLTHVWWLKPCQPPILLVNLPIQSVSGSFTTANSSPKPPGDGKSRACATRATREPTREISWIGMEAVARLAVRKTHETCRLRLSSRNRFPFWSVNCGVYTHQPSHIQGSCLSVWLQYATIHPENIVNMDF